MESRRDESQFAAACYGNENGNVGGDASCDETSLFLTLSEKDPLYQKKKRLLHLSGYGPEVQVSLSSSDTPNLILKQLAEAARIINLDEVELYFTGVDAVHPVAFYSPRNELESLKTILTLIDISLNSATTRKMDSLKGLRNATIEMITEFGDRYSEEQKFEKCTCHAEDLLLQWGKGQGVKTKLRVALVEGAGRGAMAMEDLKVGDTALEIPAAIIISEDLLYDTDMFQILKELDDTSPETMLLLWSMKERYNSESKYKFYFKTLPESFNTGLSFGIEALAALEGTLLFEEIIQAKEHLRLQYDALCPALCKNHPSIFQPDLYTWDKFLWACELWYSNSMKVIFTDGKLKTCLVPIAGLLNHSLCPHILHYGRVDSTTNSLKFSLSRPCREGEQCYLSYGNYSGSHLITFYGFLPKGENIYDIIPLDIEAPQSDEVEGCPEHEWSTHMVRGTWLSSNHELYYYGLPPPLLNYLRAALNDSKLPMENTINTENEIAVLETLCSIFSPMLEGLGVADSIEREELGWDVKLALVLKEKQRRIVSSVLSSCTAGIEMLEMGPTHRHC